MHRVKTTIYADLIATWWLSAASRRGGFADRGVTRGQRLAIATTTSHANIDALLGSALGKEWAERFAAIVAGDEVANKKPAPDVYLEVLSRLNLSASNASRSRIPA